MTTEEMIEDVIQLGVHAYKKNSGNCLEARRLNRHEPVIIEGQEFTYWRELTVYRMAEHICRIVPKSKVEVELDGNNSVLRVEVDNEEQQKLNRELYLFLEKIKQIKKQK